MDKQSMDKHSEYQKKRERREKVRSIIINVIIWLIIITFVSTLGVYWGGNAANQGSIPRIAQVNNKLYRAEPGSVYGSIMDRTRESIQRSNPGLEETELTRLVRTNSLQSLINYAVLLDFAGKSGIKPSDDYVKLYVRSRTGGHGMSAHEGLLDLIFMDYANDQIAGNNGDILNASSSISFAQLASYFDLMKVAVVADILYLDIGDMISRSISAEDVRLHYVSNLKKFASEMTVDSITFPVSNRALALEALALVQKEGFDKALPQIKGGTVSASLKLESDGVTMKRYRASIGHAENSVLTNLVFENSSYHIIRIKGYPVLTGNGTNIYRAVAEDYVALNYETLKKKYEAQVDESVRKAEAFLRTTSNLELAAAQSGMKYIRTGNTSPVNQLIRDSRSNVIEVPILENIEWFDQFFSLPVNTVSKPLSAGNWRVIMKPVYRGINTNISFADVDRDTTLRYVNFKNVAISRDWFFTQKDRASVQTFPEDLAKLDRKAE